MKPKNSNLQPLHEGNRKTTTPNLGKGVEGWEYGCCGNRHQQLSKLWPSHSSRSTELKNPCTRAAEERSVVFPAILCCFKNCKQQNAQQQKDRLRMLHSLVILYTVVRNTVTALSLSAHCEPNTTVVSTSLIHATDSPHSIAIIISLKIPTTPIHQ